MSFGERVRELRRQAKLSQRELASRVDINFTYLSKIESETVSPPSEQVIKKLAQEVASELGDVNETALSDELITLAGKIPSDLARTLSANPDVLAHLRSLSGDVQGKDDWAKNIDREQK
jgi:HTH-type transcriptional regulator, competence development regulator